MPHARVSISTDHPVEVEVVAVVVDLLPVDADGEDPFVAGLQFDPVGVFPEAFEDRSLGVIALSRCPTRDAVLDLNLGAHKLILLGSDGRRSSCRYTEHSGPVTSRVTPWGTDGDLKSKEEAAVVFGRGELGEKRKTRWPRPPRRFCIRSYPTVDLRSGSRVKWGRQATGLQCSISI